MRESQKSNTPERLIVDLGERSYPIFFGCSLLREVREHARGLEAEKRPVAVVTDANVAAAQGDFLREAFGGAPVMVLPAGEESKSLARLGEVYDFLAEKGMDRTGMLFAFGGGVAGDVAGFAAASYLRGIDFAQVPTTLLAMVDSSVGGKTGVNIPAGKNLAGAFHQPRAVYIGTEMLKTLPAREFPAGMAEVIKTALLADGALFKQLEEMERLRPEDAALPGVIRRCCEIKAEVVRADEKERTASGGRALLNLGHTFGHAVEAAAGYGEYLHGEAVAVGMVMAARLSEGICGFPPGGTERIIRLLKRYDLPVALREPLEAERLAAAMKRDKKMKQGRLRLVGLRKIGQAAVVERAGEERLRELWRNAGAR